jgi:hypothetical protein
MLLNTPDNVLQLIAIVQGPVVAVASIERRRLYHLIAIVARLLYFSQFCFNGAVLFAFVYKVRDGTASQQRQRVPITFSGVPARHRHRMSM